MDTRTAGGEPSRLIPLTGACNFRDLGGYPTTDGRTTRWGRIFRSDALHELTADDHTYLDGIGLATVVDLRTPDEASKVGRWPSGDGPRHYVNLPVIPPREDEDPTVPAPSHSDRAERYLWYLEVGGDAIVAAVELIADADRLPLVFHCAAGKDRTGIVAAMTLAAVGVDRAAIVADYAETARYMERITARLRDHPVYRPGLESIRPEDHQPDGTVMYGFLDGLDRRHGGAAAWLRGAGLPREALDHLHHLLLD